MSTTMFWNCRGARKKHTSNYLRHLVGDNEVLFVGLLETKIEVFARADADKLIGSGWDFVHRPATDRSRGILILWQKDIVMFDVLEDNEQVVVGSLALPNGQKWTTAVVYANKDHHVRRDLWDAIARHGSPDVPLLVGGDFSCCLSHADKKGGKRFIFSAGAQEMSEFMLNLDLHIFGFIRPQFTWSNNKDGVSRIWVRLDRCLMNSAGLLLAPFATIRHMGRVASDHAPLLLSLSLGGQPKSEKWLRFEDVWTTFPTSWRILWKAWSRNDFRTPAEVLNRKCRRTLRTLFHWCRNRVRELTDKQTRAECRILEL
ncbi:uncharacterized protein LOC110098167 [Dendrobium catenatum]|uniref:uncharacterized protein LOC110098167 n=1 Tax=Dendrobium catenatum TaxID=906689 RepID=UPI0009F332E3|nr:uncharacterized protein LOC110098167 [Dendrobium catenatum]